MEPAEDVPVHHFGALLAELESALPLVRDAARRGEVPHGGLSPAMLAVKALALICAQCVAADETAFQDTLKALHDAPEESTNAE
jgi:hypothetical protein